VDISVSNIISSKRADVMVFITGQICYKILKVKWVDVGSLVNTYMLITYYIYIIQDVPKERHLTFNDVYLFL